MSDIVAHLIGFYTTRPFWAGDPPNLEDPAVRFHDLLSEEVCRYSSDAFDLRFCKDGMIMLRMHALEAEHDPLRDHSDRRKTFRWWGRYLDFANTLCLLLDSALLEVLSRVVFDLSEITNRDALRIGLNKDGRPVGFGPSPDGIGYVRYNQRYGHTSAGIPFALFDMMLREPVPREVFDRVNETFSIVIDQPIMVTSLSTLARAVSQFKIGNYSTALTLAWFVIELALNQGWDRFLEAKNTTFDDASKRINAERRKRLSGRDYPVSVVSNLLELSDVLDFKTFSRVDQVRGYRNKVVHMEPGFECTSQHAGEALQLALDLTISGSPLTMRLNLSFSIHS